MENNIYSIKLPANTPLSKCGLRITLTCKCGYKTNDFKEALKHGFTHQEKFICLKCKDDLINYDEMCKHIDNCYHPRDIIKSAHVECGGLKINLF